MTGRRRYGAELQAQIDEGTRPVSKIRHGQRYGEREQDATELTSILFSDGFESGSGSAWASTNTDVTQAFNLVSAHDGIFGMECTYDGVGQFCNTTVSYTATTDVTISFWVRMEPGFDLNATFSHHAIILLSGPGGNLASFSLRQSAEGVFLYWAQTLPMFRQIDGSLNVNQWHYVKFRHVGTAGGARVEVSIDGSAFNVSTLDTSPNGDTDTIVFGGNAQEAGVISSGSIVRMDSVRVIQTLGSVNQ